jgi:anti-sigma regulatory factor (Ser/Thr protein kinase)
MAEEAGPDRAATIASPRAGANVDPPGDDKLVHQAFIYASPEQFVAGMAPFVREGLERGDTVFAAAHRPNVEALREELGEDSELVQLHDTTEWCVQPYERLQAFLGLVDALPEGTTLRAMGEPVWVGSDAVVRQWGRYESIINLALAHAPMRFICLYDGATLPDDILAYAVHTHPEQVQSAGGTVTCEAFVPPAEFVPGSPAAQPRGLTELPLDGPSLRRAVGEQALEAGMSLERAEEFVLSVYEVTSNALIHGGAPVRAHVWRQAGELIFRISDSGPGLRDPLAGWLPPADVAGGGWGLPIARQLCDAVEIVPREPGTTVSLHLSIA